MSTMPELDSLFLANAGRQLQQACHGASQKAGWWTDPTTGALINPRENNIVPTKLCLIHSEISEGMEGFRKGLQDDKLPSREMLEVELADAVIRCFDLAGAMGYDLGGAIAEKMLYNSTREDHKLEIRKLAGGKSF